MKFSFVLIWPSSVDILLLVLYTAGLGRWTTSHFSIPRLTNVGQRMLKPNILPPAKTLLIFCCQELLHGMRGYLPGWVGVGWGCQRLKVLSLSYPAHQSHHSAAHINIDAMQKYKKMQKYTMQKYKYAKYQAVLSNICYQSVSILC